MKRLFFLILVFLVFSSILEAQNLYPNPGKHSTEWLTNVEHYPAYTTVYNDTLTSTHTTDWFPLYKWGGGIFRISVLCDTATIDVTKTTNPGLYMSFEMLIDSADTRVAYTNYDDTNIIVASGSAISTSPPFGKVFKLSVYMARWIRFTFNVADTCSLTVHRGDHW